MHTSVAGILYYKSKFAARYHKVQIQNTNRLTLAFLRSCEAGAQVKAGVGSGSIWILFFYANPHTLFVYLSTQNRTHTFLELRVVDGNVGRCGFSLLFRGFLKGFCGITLSRSCTCTALYSSRSSRKDKSAAYRRQICSHFVAGCT